MFPHYSNFSETSQGKSTGRPQDKFHGLHACENRMYSLPVDLFAFCRHKLFCVRNFRKVSFVERLNFNFVFLPYSQNLVFSL